ncbi:Bug family tripartite tricarboxylate transporter substrate binding protein [Variovorax paradoxus]|uniref:Bug family tripartite tricarboxylate transporter substrate binding protein n=1 Tax=Variovorax paradoxus TaxID=34073 RepID=UPI0029C96029|nr:tripartite tricarboxylate transporter substrate binding protein [Variovorax paradoxus]
MTSTLTHRRACAALAAFALAAPAFAQNGVLGKPLRIVVGYPAGQTVDIVARNFAAALGKEIGQPVIVDNRPGANGSLGAQEVKKSTPDGTTILLGTLGQMTINPTLYKKLPYDTLKDFAPIAQVSTGALLLVATPSFGPNNLRALIDYAKARPGEVDFASGGNGITAHLAMVVLERQAGIQLNHIPYKGSPAAINDVMGGQVPIMFDAIAATLPQVRSGKLKPLAVSSPKRNPQLPDVPTVAEQGLTGFDISSWVGFLAPAGTPPATVTALHDAIARASANPEIQESIRATGSELAITSPDEFGRFLQSEIRKWGQAVNDAGVQVD